MNRRESILVSVLAGALVAAAAVTAIVLQVERRSEVRQRIAVMERELAKLSERGGDEAALLRQRDLLVASMGAIDGERRPLRLSQTARTPAAWAPATSLARLSPTCSNSPGAQPSRWQAR